MLPSNGDQAFSQHLRKRLYAFVLGQRDDVHQRLFRNHKQDLFKDLEGKTILELGPATGLNLSFLPEDVNWIGVEPNPYMHRHIRQKAHEQGRSIQLCRADVDMLPEYNDSIDAVISTRVLCSVQNVDRVLQEVYRVLKPGGTFYFIEHVLADPDTYLWQAQVLFRHVWTILADGCRLDCCTHEAIERAGFSEVSCERVEVGPSYNLTRTHVIGQAVKA